MRMRTKILIVLMVVACLFQAVSAASFEVSTSEISPDSTTLTPGESVRVHCVVSLTGSGDHSFPSDGYLQLSTDLTSPSWTYKVLLSDIPAEQVPSLTSKNPYLKISGFSLDYPEARDPQLDIVLQGTVPTVLSEQQKTLIKISQLDSSQETISNGVVSIQRDVINPEDVSKSISAAQSRLDTLKTSIDEKTAQGADTSAAQAKYNEAKTAINQAQATSDSAAASEDLKTATDALNKGETLLAQAWAQTEITNTQDTLNEIDDIITYFETDRNMGSDQRVINLKTQRDLAAQALSSANDQMTAKNYDAARIKAEAAYTKANSTLALGTQLKQNVGEGFSLNLGNLPLYIGIGILIILIIGGVIYIRNKRRWDELG